LSLASRFGETDASCVANYASLITRANLHSGRGLALNDNRVDECLVDRCTSVRYAVISENRSEKSRVREREREREEA
jgi:hypothetical protein